MPAPPLRVDTTEIIVIGRPAPQGSKRHLGRGARSRTGASPSALRDAARARVGTKHRLPLDLPSSAGRGIAAGQAPVVVSAVPDVTPAVNAGAA